MASRAERLFDAMQDPERAGLELGSVKNGDGKTLDVILAEDADGTDVPVMVILTKAQSKNMDAIIAAAHGLVAMGEDDGDGEDVDEETPRAAPRSRGKFKP